MDVLIQQLINGLVIGCLYAVIALGYTMVYGVLGIINFAHGDLLMIGAMVALSTINFLQSSCPLWPTPVVLLMATITSALVCMVISYVMEKVAYRPLRFAPRLAPLITAIGVSILLQTLAMLIWSRNPLSFPQLISATPIPLYGEATITIKELIIILTAVLMMLTLLFLVNKTKMGRAMRATAENPQIASLMGVNPDMIISLTFILGAAMAAVAGVLMSSNYGVAHFYMGFLPGIKAFTAAVLGGIGNIAGAMIGGILLGLIEVLGAGYIGDVTNGVLGSNYQDIFAFLVLILVLIFRPNGIMGERLADRV